MQRCLLWQWVALMRLWHWALPWLHVFSMLSQQLCRGGAQSRYVSRGYTCILQVMLCCGSRRLVLGMGQGLLKRKAGGGSVWLIFISTFWFSCLGRAAAKRRVHKPGVNSWLSCAEVGGWRRRCAWWVQQPIAKVTGSRWLLRGHLRMCR